MRRLLIFMPLMALLGACTEGPRRTAQHITPSPHVSQCLSRLGATRANFTPIPDRYFGAGCSTLGSVRLASLHSDEGQLGVSNLGPVTCPLAETFAAWARFGADRAARQILGSELVRIETMGSYTCRNVAGTTRRSAHASANAIDISAFTLLAMAKRAAPLMERSGGGSIMAMSYYGGDKVVPGYNVMGVPRPRSSVPRVTSRGSSGRRRSGLTQSTPVRP